MREPGEDDAGEYWHMASVQAHPRDNCGCPKPGDCYGTRGWHLNSAGAAYERCPRAATVKHTSKPKERRERRGSP